MYCNHCGQEIADGSKFCGKCGKPVHGATPPPAQPTPTSIATSAGKLDDNVGMLLEIIMSVFIIITAFIPWGALDAWIFDINGSVNFFDVLNVLADYDHEVLAMCIRIFWFITAALHGFAIYSSIVKEPARYVRHGTAAIFTAILGIAGFAVIALIKHDVRESWLPAAASSVKYGIGAILCLAISVIQLASYGRLHDLTRKQDHSVPSDTKVICPHCGTTYTKLTAATPCPACHKLPGDISIPKKVTVEPSKSNTVTCPFCKRIYPKGTIYCTDCNAKIGAADAPKKAAYCHQCGAKLGENTSFCAQCGAKI